MGPEPIVVSGVMGPIEKWLKIFFWVFGVIHPHFMEFTNLTYNWYVSQLFVCLGPG